MSPTKLPTGKVSKELLRKYVFTCLGIPDKRIIAGPMIGEDAAIIDTGDTVLIAKANPITGAEKKIGWLSVHINANDVVVRGASPRWFMSVVLLPEDSEEVLLETIMREQHEACSELGVCIIGGHTEVAPDLGRPIVSGFMLGEARKDEYITTSGAQVGDHIILTKGVGLEGTGILAADLHEKLMGKVSEEMLDNAVNFLDLISVVPEAKTAMEIDGIHSMHTPTEGGVINGLLEMSEASGNGFKVYEDLMLIHEETRVISNVLSVDPLRLLSSGSLMIVVDPEKSDELINLLISRNILSKIIGEVTPDSKVLVRSDGSEEYVDDVVQDELFRVLAENT